MLNLVAIRVKRVTMMIKNSAFLKLLLNENRKYFVKYEFVIY